MEKRYLVFASLSVAALGLAGCSIQTDEPSSEPVPTAVSGTASQAPSDAPSDASVTQEPTADRDSIFSPLTSVVDYWQDNPSVAHERARTGTVLLNEQGSGPKSFDVPDAQEHEAVMIVLICDSESSYNITIGNNTDPAIAFTGGDSCGGPTINGYTSSPYDPADPDAVPEFIDVDVPPEVNYYVTVYGVEGT
jgi:hypothetical protein